MVSPTNFPPTADNPDRAPTTGAGNDFVVTFQAGDNASFLRHDGVWAVPPGGGGGGTWGSITGTLSNQTDLQNALNLKANISSLATVATTGAYNDLSGKPTLGTLAALSYPGGTSAFLRADGTWQIPVDVNAAWGNITGTLSSQGDLNTALNAKAPLASPTFTGTPAAPTAAVSTNTTQLATTAYVIAQLGTSNPVMNGTASSGASLRITREDHVHPSDTSRMPNVLTTTGDMVYSSSGTTAARLPVGTTGQILTVASGAPQWASLVNGPGFSVFRSTAQSLTTGAWNEIEFNSAAWDPQSAVNLTTGRFNPQVAGTYQINSFVGVHVTSGLTNIQCAIYKNGVAYKYGSIETTGVASGMGTDQAPSLSAQVQMNGTTDYLSFYIFSDGVSPVTSTGPLAWMDGFLIPAGVAGGGGASVAWGAITGTLSAQSDLNTALGLKAPLASPTFAGTVTIPSGASIAGFAPLASPTFTGTPASTTAAVDTKTTQVATTAFVVGQASGANPLMNGTVAQGTSLRYSRQDHVHASDTSRAPLASPTFTGTPAAPTASVGTSTTQLATTAFVQAEKAPRVQAVTSSATVTPTFSNDAVKITAQAVGLTLANPTGTAVDMAGMAIRIKDNGTARSISFGTQYRAIGVTLPTTTVVGKTLYLGMIYNTEDTKWDVTAVAQEA